MTHPEIVNSITDFYLNKIEAHDALVLFDAGEGLDSLISLERGNPQKIALLIQSYLMQNPDVLDELLRVACV